MNQEKIINRNKGKKMFMIFLFFCFGLFLLSYMIPRVMMKKPKINNSFPKNILEGTAFSDTGELVLQGSGFSNIIGIYINGKYEPRCTYTIVSEEEMRVVLPNDLYAKAGKLELFMEKRSNSDIISRTNKIEIPILKKDGILPQITKITPDKLESKDTAATKWFTIECENFNGDGAVLVDGVEIDSFYDTEKQILSFKLDYSKWCTKDFISIKVRKNYNGYATSEISGEYKIQVVNKKKEIKHSYPWLKHRFITHAFGEFHGEIDTNSKEAFELNYKKGQRVFEVDFQFTEDGVLVGKNDWGTELPVTFKELKENTTSGTIISFDDICELLKQYKDMYLVTNTKEGTSMAIDYMFWHIVKVAKKYDKSILDRIIVQIYNQEMYEQLMNIYPFQSVVYNLSQDASSNEQILDFVEKTGIKVVTMSGDRYSLDFGQNLYDLGCYSYIYMVNDKEVIKEYLIQGVYGFYTDSLAEKDKTIPWDLYHSATDTFKMKEKIQKVTTIDEYFKAMKTMDCLAIVSVKDEASTNFQETTWNEMQKLGATKDLRQVYRGSYVLIKNKDKVISEELDSQKKITYSNLLDDVKIKVESAGLEIGNLSKIEIDKKDYSLNMRGFNIVLYDLKTKQVIDSVNFDLFEGEKFTRNTTENIHAIDTLSKSKEELIQYLNSLNDDRYIVAFSVKDEASTLMTDEIRDIFKAWNFKENILSDFRYSFLGILNHKKNVVEQYGNEALYYEGIIDDIHFEIKSAGLEAGNYSSIRIDGVEYSTNVRGLNIVVYDKWLGKVIHKVGFDLCENYTRTNG